MRSADLIRSCWWNLFSHSHYLCKHIWAWYWYEWSVTLCSSVWNYCCHEWNSLDNEFFPQRRWVYREVRHIIFWVLSEGYSQARAQPLIKCQWPQFSLYSWRATPSLIHSFSYTADPVSLSVSQCSTNLWFPQNIPKAYPEVMRIIDRGE